MAANAKKPNTNVMALSKIFCGLVISVAFLCGNTTESATQAPVVTQTPSATQAPPTYRSGPQYTINCLENGDVEVKGLAANSSLVVQKKTGCVQATEPTYRIFSNCTSPNNVNGERTVTVEIYDPKFDGTMRPSPTPNVKNLTGGQYHHIITVKCTPLPTKGMKVQVVHGIKVETATVSRPDAVNDVAMYLKADRFDARNDITSLPDISSVYIGDKFYLYLVYLGTQNYSAIPTHCSAFEDSSASEPSSTVNHVDLWTNTGCLTTSAKAYRIMHKFEEVGTKAFRAEMFGFQFNGKGDVTFVCEVNICSNCTLPATCSTSWSSRRRRSENRNFKKQFKVTKKIRVLNRPFENASVTPSSSGLLITVVFVLLRLTGFIGNEK